MKITVIGIDLAKSLFQVHGVDGRGKAVLRKQLKRKDVASFFANLEPCLIGMEACGGAHYWGYCQVRQVRDVMHRWTPTLHQATGDIASPSRSFPTASGCIFASA